MLVRQSIALGALSLSAITAAGAAAAPGMDLRGEAPPVCSAGIDQPGRGAGGGSGVAIGQLLEFCNAPDGYEVWRDYPADLVGAVLVVDGKDLPLTEARTVRVSHVAGPANVRHRLQLRADPGRRTATLTVRMLPAPPPLDIALR